MYPRVKKLIESSHHEIACMIVEPMVQGAAGMLMYSANYLKQVRELTRRYNIHLIDDEIAMGFGRTGKCLPVNMQESLRILCVWQKDCPADIIRLLWHVLPQIFLMLFTPTTRRENLFTFSYLFRKSFRMSCCRRSITNFPRRKYFGYGTGKRRVFTNKMEELFQGREYVKSYRRMGMIGAIELHDIPGQERMGRKIAALALEKEF